MAYGIKTGGRQAGTPNRITSQFKDAVRTVYEDIGGHAAFAEWAKANQGDFYRIAAKLIPTEAPTGQDAHRKITVNITGLGDIPIVAFERPRELNYIDG
jgi:hypothetical protein